MPTLEDIIDLQITVTDKAPSKANFGIPLIAAYHTAWLDRVREYSNADDLLDDGFTTAHAVYNAAVAIKSQNPSPKTFKVGRLENAPIQSVDLIVESAVEGFVYNGTINGVAITYTVLAAATLTTVATAIELLVEAVAGIASTSAVATITAVGAAGEVNSFYFDRGMKIIDNTPDPGLAADLAAIYAEDSDWYGLLLVVNSAANITAAATWTEANKKIFIAQTSDWDVVDAGQTNDIASDLVALAFSRTAGIYHRVICRTTDYTSAAWLGKMLPFDPGSVTWAFKELAGTGVDELLAGERSALVAKRWTQYEAVSGQNITFEGRTPSGRFIDVTHFVDWQDAEIKADVFSLLVNNPKVPYTDTGINAVKGAVQGALKKGQERGGLADDPAPTVTVPLATETDAADRVNRILRDVEFTARLAGALHSIVIRGTVSV